MSKLGLPIKITQETTDAILRVYRKIGSITNCKTVEDFGRYRFVLVQEFDKEIKSLKVMLKKNQHSKPK